MYNESTAGIRNCLTRNLLVLEISTMMEMWILSLLLIGIGPGQNLILLNIGYGVFTVSKTLDQTSETSYDAELADFDNDGDLDMDLILTN